MNLSDEIRKQIEKNKGLKLAVGEINNHLSILEGLVRKDIEEQKNEAYQKGYDAGIIASSFVDKSDEAYQRGLDDAWECARELYLNGACKDLFGEYFNTFIKNHTAQEAIEKLKAYEEKQKTDNEIKVGDEVYCKGDDTSDSGVVTWVGKKSIYAMWQDGSAGEVQKDEFIKTGRHFDIDKILEEMRHD